MKNKLYLALHLFLMLYSLSGVVSKLAAGKPFMSPAFIALYGIEILILGFYAIGWQQFIKRMPLSVAYANKAVTVVWGCVGRAHLPRAAYAREDHRRTPGAVRCGALRLGRRKGGEGMNGQLILYACIMLLGVFISSVAQVLLKKAAQKQYGSVLEEYLNWPVITAYAIFFAATFLSIYAYKVVPLSMGPILEATGYIYVTIFGVTIFHEKLDRWKLIALALIIGGIIVYSALG